MWLCSYISPPGVRDGAATAPRVLIIKQMTPSPKGKHDPDGRDLKSLLGVVRLIETRPRCHPHPSEDPGPVPPSDKGCHVRPRLRMIRTNVNESERYPKIVSPGEYVDDSPETCECPPSDRRSRRTGTHLYVDSPTNPTTPHRPLPPELRYWKHLVCD